MTGDEMNALVVQIRADVKDFEKNIAKLSGISGKQFEVMQRQMRKAEREFNQL